MNWGICISSSNGRICLMDSRFDVSIKCSAVPSYSHKKKPHIYAMLFQQGLVCAFSIGSDNIDENWNEKPENNSVGKENSVTANHKTTAGQSYNLLPRILEDSRVCILTHGCSHDLSSRFEISY